MTCSNNARPNILLILTDEERQAPAYENEALAAFRANHLPGRQALRNNALVFNNHYIGSSACVPSRATLFTGHYPSLHGATQTGGVAKDSFDREMFWLEPNTVPTLGHYFRTGGYRTFYNGKWDMSRVNIYNPVTRAVLNTVDEAGATIPANEELYRHANRLEIHGFSDWIGHDANGPNKADTGLLRDSLTAKQTLDRLAQLEKDHQAGDTRPWLMVCALVNPHDIGLYGLPWLEFGESFAIDERVPEVPPAANRLDPLTQKPSAQKNYVQQYRLFAAPQPASEHYRRFYYHLHLMVDDDIQQVHKGLLNSVFHDNTYIVFTSDHGTMLGDHGGMHQKWHNAYEETVHVPLVISHPGYFQGTVETNALTSHLDLVPTLMGLAGIEADQAAADLAKSHSQVKPLVGRDLSQAVRSQALEQNPEETVFFLSDDAVSEGNSPIREGDVEPVKAPHDLEAIVARHSGRLWKYTRYWQNTALHGDPAEEGTAPDEFELYDLAADPYEMTNLAHPDNQTPASLKIQAEMAARLAQARQEKRLIPD